MKLLFFILFLFQFSFGQILNEYANIDKKMDKIPDSLSSSTTGIANYILANFKSESDKIRAVFYWTASTISYDIANMNEPNFVYSPQEKIDYVFKTKKGVCIHYAEIFNDIVTKIGIKTKIIGGYTKQNGKISLISHAWCASKIDGTWFLFDPTWGSGYVNGEKFYKKLNNSYFKVAASKMILSHIPFDYLWQFSKNPITNNEFYSGKLTNEKNKISIDFLSEIEKYEKLPVEEQAFEASKRIEKNGIINDLISKYLAQKKEEFTVLRQNKNIEKLNAVVTNFNEGIASLNDFIFYRNNKFKPTFSDEIISEMIKNPLGKLKNCQAEISKIGSVGKENSVSLNALRNQIGDALKQAEEQNDFVKDYLSKSKSKRKSMFSKVTWFGIPLR